MKAVYENPPGHPQSVKDGCTCPVIDNGYGRGCGYVDDLGNPLFYHSQDCPLHGQAKALHENNNSIDSTEKQHDNAKRID